jgi:uncharacterized damage-inducible protein DinB
VAATVGEHLLELLDQAYNRRSWHGTNLRGSLRGLSAEDAAWRPGRDRHNIWELAVHCAYWKYAVWRRVTGAQRGSFPLEGSNWLSRPVDRTEGAWQADIALLNRMHAMLREAAAGCSPADLDRRPKGSAFSNAQLISGAAAHDLYHAGQIQILKRLRPRRR